MRTDFGLVSALILECIIFIYYSNTLFYRKRSKLFCGIIISAGYILHFLICSMGNTIINTLTFFMLNVLAFIICFHINYKTAIFQGAILVILSAGCELAVVYTGKLGISADNLTDLSSIQSLILTMSGKSLYLTGVMILTHIFKKNGKYADGNSVCLILIPVLTLLILLLLLKISVNNYIQLSICIICITIDIVVLILNQNFTVKQIENEALRLQTQKDEKNFEDYIELKHLRHDMNEHLEALTALISADNKQAKDYICSLCSKKEIPSDIIDYTDNSMINIVLSKKMKECDQLGITFSLDPVQAQLGFFGDMDSVTIFSNLINNAIDGCKSSDTKKIYMNIYTVNKNFVVIKINNTSEDKPLVIDGNLKTHKDNDLFHGIGISSIKQTIKKYHGSFSWTYDEAEKIFCSTVVIQRFDITKPSN